MKIIKVLCVGLLLFFSGLMLSITLPYLLPPFPTHIDFLSTKQHILHLDWWRWSFYIHITTSFFVLLSGATQFSKTILQKKPLLHRQIGKFYVFLILCFSAPSGLIMAFYANAGLYAQLGFISLSILWWVFTFLAYQYARKGKLYLHGKFIIRSYALTLSAVTLRLWIYVFAWLQVPLDYYQTYVLVAWISWILNLGLAELLMYNGLVDYFFKR